MDEDDLDVSLDADEDHVVELLNSASDAANNNVWSPNLILRNDSESEVCNSINIAFFYERIERFILVYLSGWETINLGCIISPVSLYTGVGRGSEARP